MVTIAFIVVYEVLGYVLLHAIMVFEAIINKHSRMVYVTIDWFSKFVILQPVKQATSKPVIKFLEKQVSPASSN